MENDKKHDSLTIPVERAQTRIWLFALVGCLALAGLADAMYLTVEHLSGRSVRCAVVTGCDTVLSSSYATLFGIPLAAFGACAYFAVFSLAVCIVFGYRFLRFPLQVVIAMMFVMSVWLVGLQIFTLNAFCFYCLVSAAITFSMTALIMYDLLPVARRP